MRRRDPGVATRRGTRHETATERRELAFTKHQNGTYRDPVISPYSFRTRIGKGPRERKKERDHRSSRAYTHTYTNRYRVSYS